MNSKWIEWAQKLQAIAQNGLTYTENQFEVERYEQVQNIAAEIIREHTEHSYEEIKTYFDAEKGYSTPKVDTRGAVFRDGNILLVKERFEQQWTLPGGWADVWISPSANVEREVLEESGFTVKAEKLAAIFDRNKHPHKSPFPHNIYKMFFLCSILEGEPKLSYEITDIDFFPEDGLPELCVKKTTEWQIKRMFEHYKNPGMPADFD